MNKSTLEGLPPQFVTSLKILFDILDERKNGFIKLCDLESRWEDGTVEYLPSSVIDCLKKVVPSSGELNFEQFVTGLRISLLQHKKESKPVQTDNRNNYVQTSTWVPSTTNHSDKFVNSKNGTFVPTTRSIGQVTQSHPHMTLEFKRKGTSNQVSQPSVVKYESHGDYIYNKNRRPGDGRSSIASASALEFMNKKYLDSENDGKSQATNRRREPRRHTLANGIDYNMMKKMKHLEQEKKVLSQGLKMVEKARNWYGEQLSSVEEKMKYVGTTNTRGDQSIEASEEKLNLESARIQEVNHQLQALVDSSQKGFALHMNLAVAKGSQKNTSKEEEAVINMLKSQNRMLTKEISDKSDKIAQLEKEKTQLIRKMFEASSGKNKPNYEDTTFI